MKTFTVIYRVGGTERFEWRRVNPVALRDSAEQVKAELERAGYKALIHDTDRLNAIGMPETYEP